MVLPLVGLAAGVAARAVAKKVASNAVKKAATKKLVKEAAKKKPLTNPKSAVKVKPAAKPVGNRPNPSKAEEEMISSVSRGGVGRQLGKAKTARKFQSSTNKAKPNASTPSRTPEQGNRGAFSYNTVKINSQRNLKKK
jgi:hypothetical protein